MIRLPAIHSLFPGCARSWMRMSAEIGKSERGLDIDGFMEASSILTSEKIPV